MNGNTKEKLLYSGKGLYFAKGVKNCFIASSCAFFFFSSKLSFQFILPMLVTTVMLMLFVGYSSSFLYLFTKMFSTVGIFLN